MSTPPTIKLPHLSLPHQTTALKGRKRSGSIVKVEEVGGRVEELLDRSTYVNINANWVNAKGVCAFERFDFLCAQTSCYRRMVNPRRPRLHGQDHHRHHPRHDAANQLDSYQPVIPCSERPIPLYTERDAQSR